MALLGTHKKMFGNNDEAKIIGKGPINLNKGNIKSHEYFMLMDLSITY